MNKDRIYKVIKGALIAGAGCVLTYLSQYLSGVDFGFYSPIVTSVLAVAVNFLRKLREESKEVEDENQITE